MNCEECERLQGRIDELLDEIGDLVSNLDAADTRMLSIDSEEIEELEERLTAASAIVYELHWADGICLCSICSNHRRRRQ